MYANREVKKKGFMGVDKSGSFAQMPLVIASVYGQQEEFTDVIKLIRAIASREKRVLSSVKELKSRDLKSRSVQLAVFEALSRLHFKAVIINSATLGMLAGQFRTKRDYLKKLEAIFWAQPIRQLLFALARENILPKKAYLDYNFGSENDQRCFEEQISCIIHQSTAQPFSLPFFVSAESRHENALMAADFISGLLRKNRELQIAHKEKVETLTAEMIKDDVERTFKK